MWHPEDASPFRASYGAGDVVILETMYGWPFNAAWSGDIFIAGKKRKLVYDSFFIFADLYVALAILLAVWFVCERWIAWRAGRKKETDS